MFSLDKRFSLGTHIRLFLQNPPTNWSFRTQMYAYAHNTTPLSQLKLFPHQIVYHTHPRIQLKFSLNLTRDSSKTCLASFAIIFHLILVIVTKISIPSLNPSPKTYFIMAFNS